MKNIAILILGLIGITTAHDFKTCGKEVSQKVVVSKLDFSTETVSPGTKLGITIKGNTWVEFDDKTKAKIGLKLHGVHIYSTEVYPCKEFQGLNCPVVGNFEGTMDYDIPEYSPHTNIEMEVKLEDSAEGEIGCFETKIDIQNKLGVNAQYKHIFDLYIKKYGWKIDNYRKRLNVFVKNLLKVVEHNMKQNETYKLELNHFAYLTQEEFWATKGGYRKIQGTQSTNLENIKNVPESVDWRSKLVPVKNQGNCGSCFSFSAIVSSEFAYFLKTGKIVSFSEQQIVSCDTEKNGGKDNSCNGGLMDWVFDWEENHQGFCLEEEYPYVSGNGTVPECRKCNNIKDSIVKNFVDITPNSEEELKKVVSQRVVSVAVAANSNFQFYRDGVFSGWCPGNSLNHGVALVGYGTDNETGLDYWILRNSWGNEWGEKGYMRIQRGKKGFFNKSGQCGVLAQSSYPNMI